MMDCRWRRMKALWRKAIPRRDLVEWGVMEQQEIYSLTVAATTGRWSWVLQLGMQLVLPTNQPRRMSGLARMPPPGSSRGAIVTSWWGITTRKCWWMCPHSWSGLVSSWIMTTTCCLSMTRLTLSISTLSMWPSFFQFVQHSQSGTNP